MGGEGGRVLFMQQVASFWDLLPQTAVDSIRRFKKDYQANGKQVHK